MRKATALLLAAAVALSAGCAIRDRSPRTFSFAVLGDQQYNAREELLFPHLLDAISRESVEFVVHVGDFKAGSDAPCTDELFERRYREFSQSRHPFIYLPGDNEWVDCRRPSNGVADPLVRLQRLREIFFPTPASLGKTSIPLDAQSVAFASDPVLSRYRENVMWRSHGVVFVTVNVQGSNDNLGFDAAGDREHAQRSRANAVWLGRAMQQARAGDMLGIVVFLQANPGFEEAPETVARSGYRDFLQLFEREAAALAKPVLLVHGDTHQFRIDRPYISPLTRLPVANAVRVETWGSPVIDWLRITVDPAERSNPHGLFRIESGGGVHPPPATN